ncbi:MAG: hypothetical protein JSS72_07420 [Armatimonadetes bacterium]|nr:hypothetical protein [Armatimonadota bacterium]
MLHEREDVKMRVFRSLGRKRAWLAVPLGLGLAGLVPIDPIVTKYFVSARSRADSEVASDIPQGKQTDTYIYDARYSSIPELSAADWASLIAVDRCVASLAYTGGHDGYLLIAVGLSGLHPATWSGRHYQIEKKVGSGTLSDAEVWDGPVSKVLLCKDVLTHFCQQPNDYAPRVWDKLASRIRYVEIEPKPIYESDFYEQGYVVGVYAEFSSKKEASSAVLHPVASPLLPP